MCSLFARSPTIEHRRAHMHPDAEPAEAAGAAEARATAPRLEGVKRRREFDIRSGIGTMNQAPVPSRRRVAEER